MRGRFVGVAGWQKVSLIDFPGTVSTVLFYSGCNLRCPYCHNPDLALFGEERGDFQGGGAPPMSAMPDSSESESGIGVLPPEEKNPCPTASPENGPHEESITGFLQKRKGKIEGVVLSGGEPTIHQPILEDVKIIRLLGYKIKLDTNGLLPGMVQQINPDYLALDIKTIPSLYSVLLSCQAGDVNRRLEESVRLAKSMGERAEIRITVSPGVVDAKSIMQMGELIQGVSRVFLQPLQQRVKLLDRSYEHIEPYPPETIRTFRDILSEYAKTCEIRGE